MKILKQIITWVSIAAVVGACVALTVILTRKTPVKAENGINGQNGLSAYEIAVNNGFVGTESEWLASLHGTDGIDGINGTDGINGSTAFSGVFAFDQDGAEYTVMTNQRVAVYLRILIKTSNGQDYLLGTITDGVNTVSWQASRINGTSTGNYEIIITPQRLVSLGGTGGTSWSMSALDFTRPLTVKMRCPNEYNATGTQTNIGVYYGV